MLNNPKLVEVDQKYLSEISFAEYEAIARTSFPDLHDLLDPSLTDETIVTDYVTWMNGISWEFEDAGAGGRGAAYNVAQKSLRNRQAGMTALLKCFSPSFQEMPNENVKILDVLGGDGTIARFVSAIEGLRPRIFTADLSRYMVEACLKQSIACVRQSATRSLFRDNVLDGVLIAYGTHHLGTEERQQAVNESHRTLRAGGRLVLHDFESDGGTARWFEDVVHPYSRTGHPHPHFTRGEMWSLLEKAGFRDVRIFDLNDPFTLTGATAEEAKTNALMHMYHMYDLVRIANAADDILPRVAACVEQTLGAIEVSNTDGEFLATIPRHALVAVGTKS